MDTSGNVLVDTEVAGAAATSIDCSSPFLGDTDGWYTVIVRHIYDTADSTMNLTFNADTTAANYGYLGITANNTTVANINSTAATIRLCAVASGSTSGFSILTLYAKQGAVRLMNGFNVCNINGTTVTQLETIGSVWNNTNTQITNMVFTPSAGKIGIGGRVIILKGNALAVGTSPGTTGAWKRVGTSVLGGNASSVTFSGLKGNTAVCYYLSAQIKASGNVGDGFLNFNADGGSNYGRQYLYGSSTTVGAARGAYVRNFTGLYADNGNYAMSNGIIFAKSGFLRPSIFAATNNISGTTITQCIVQCSSWNNTADEMTQIVVSTDANNFATGSQFDLYALYT